MPFIRYAKAKCDTEADALAYRVYTGEALRCIAMNVSKLGGVEMKLSILDLLIHDKKPEVEQTEEEVIDHMKRQLNLIGSGT